MYKFLALWKTGDWVLPLAFLLHFHIRLLSDQKKLWYIKYSSRSEQIPIGLVHDWAYHIDHSAVYSRVDPMWRSKGRMLALSKVTWNGCAISGLCRKKLWKSCLECPALLQLVLNFEWNQHHINAVWSQGWPSLRSTMHPDEFLI